MRTLPWLQDILEDPVWTRWGVTYRDVRILDSQNRLFAVFNLTQNDLAVDENRDTLKQLFLNAAKVVDTDEDGLPDDWELHFFGDLSANPGDDPDGDGADNWTEFVFGTNPKDAKSAPALKARLASKGQQTFLTTSFHPRAGAMLEYVVEASPDLQQWTASTAEVLAQPPRNLFDGTGTLEAIYSLAKPISEKSQGFLRVRVIRKYP